MKFEKLIVDKLIQEDEDHLSNSTQTPLRPDAFELSPDEKNCHHPRAC